MLEELRREGRQVSLRVIGGLSIADDIDPDLARATISAVRVRGSFHATEAVREALADRINA